MSARSKQEKKKGGIGKVLLILLAVVSIIAIGVYIAGVIYFQQHFFYRTTVGNTDVSFMDVDTSVNTLSNATNTYKIKITAPGDKVYEVKGKDISMSLASNAKATVEEEIKSQIDEAIYEDQVGMMEMVLDIDEITSEMKDVRGE